MFRLIIDATSRAAGRTNGATHALPEKVRHQTTLDYKRTAPGVYNLPNTATDLSKYLPDINVPALILWGDRDLTLAPGSFPRLVEAMPRAQGKVIYGAGHVPHQSNPVEYNQLVLEFLRNLESNVS
jgi:pimeloyl-ACP methyl ester carboxylesterase